METKNIYIAPELTVVTFKTERGYAVSNIATNINDMIRIQLMQAEMDQQIYENYNSQNQEVWDINDETLLFDYGFDRW